MSNEAKNTNEAIEIKTTTINLLDVDNVKLLVSRELKAFKEEFSSEFLEEEPSQEELEKQAKEEQEELRSIVADEVRTQIASLQAALENTVNCLLKKHGLIQTLESIAPVASAIEATKTETKKRIVKKKNKK